jgi:hypothetical protein
MIGLGVVHQRSKSFLYNEFEQETRFPSHDEFSSKYRVYR